MQLMECCGTLDKKKSKTLLKKICGKRPRFEDDGGHDDKKESLCSTSVRKRKKSVTFDLSGLLEMLSMNGTERQGRNPDHTPDNKTIRQKNRKNRRLRYHR